MHIPGCVCEGTQQRESERKRFCLFSHIVQFRALDCITHIPFRVHSLGKACVNTIVLRPKLAKCNCTSGSHCCDNSCLITRKCKYCVERAESDPALVCRRAPSVEYRNLLHVRLRDTGVSPAFTDGSPGHLLDDVVSGREVCMERTEIVSLQLRKFLNRQ